MAEECAIQIKLSSAAAAPAFRPHASSLAIVRHSLRCSNHTNEIKNVSEDIQTPSLTHHRTRHPDFLPRRGENLPRRGKNLPRLPGKTTTPINSNLNPQKTNHHGRRNRNSSSVRIHALRRHQRPQRMVICLSPTIEQALNKPCSIPVQTIKQPPRRLSVSSRQSPSL